MLGYHVGKGGFVKHSRQSTSAPNLQPSIDVHSRPPDF